VRIRRWILPPFWFVFEIWSGPVRLGRVKFTLTPRKCGSALRDVIPSGQYSFSRRIDRREFDQSLIPPPFRLSFLRRSNQSQRCNFDDSPGVRRNATDLVAVTKAEKSGHVGRLKSRGRFGDSKRSEKLYLVSRKRVMTCLTICAACHCVSLADAAMAAKLALESAAPHASGNVRRPVVKLRNVTRGHLGFLSSRETSRCAWRGRLRRLRGNHPIGASGCSNALRARWRWRGSHPRYR
jgi:hypothetical protein